MPADALTDADVRGLRVLADGPAYLGGKTTARIGDHRPARIRSATAARLVRAGLAHHNRSSHAAEITPAGREALRAHDEGGRS